MTMPGAGWSGRAPRASAAALARPQRPGEPFSTHNVRVTRVQRQGLKPRLGSLMAFADTDPLHGGSLHVLAGAVSEPQCASSLGRLASIYPPAPNHASMWRRAFRADKSRRPPTTTSRNRGVRAGMMSPPRGRRGSCGTRNCAGQLTTTMVAVLRPERTLPAPADRTAPIRPKGQDARWPRRAAKSRPAGGCEGWPGRACWRGG